MPRIFLLGAVGAAGGGRARGSIALEAIAATIPQLLSAATSPPLDRLQDFDRAGAGLRDFGLVSETLAKGSLP